MTLRAATESVLNYFQRNVSRDVAPLVPFYRDNEAYDASGVPCYLIAGMQTGETEQVSLGPAGNRLYRQRATLTILHAIRAGDRSSADTDGRATIQFHEIEAKTKEVMQGRRIGTAELTLPIQTSILGRVGGYYHSLISIPFDVFARY